VTWYLSIEPQQEPFDVGPDDRGRPQVSFNVLCLMRPSSDVVSEVLGILDDAGVGTSANLFGSSAAILPIDDGPFLVVKSQAGVSPNGTHNGGAAAYRRPGLQLIATASTFVAADALARAAYNALVAVRNQQVSA